MACEGEELRHLDYVKVYKHDLGENVNSVENRFFPNACTDWFENLKHVGQCDRVGWDSKLP
jgi:hypothetical protein